MIRVPSLFLNIDQFEMLLHFLLQIIKITINVHKAIFKYLPSRRRLIFLILKLVKFIISGRHRLSCFERGFRIVFY
jgi:hypothetical protein